MTRVVRSRAHRRRATGKTLVRPRPTPRIPPPPIPLLGFVQRRMTAEAIADYAGISTGTWSSGATGNWTNVNGVGTTPNTSMNCWYHHVVSSNQRTVGIDVTLNPIRYRVECSDTDGQQYDQMVNMSTPTPSSVKAHAEGNSLSSPSRLGLHGLAKTPMPAGLHCEFKDGFTQIAFLESVDGVVPCRRRGFVPNEWIETTLQSISPTTEIFGSRVQGTFPLQGGGVQQLVIAAIQHRLNGVAAGARIDNPNRNFDSADMRLDILPDDIYELDVWFRMISQPNPAYNNAAGKACLYIPTTKVHNGSRCVSNVSYSTENGYSEAKKLIKFFNVDFSPSFNYREQTYRVTAAGHSGWTLKGGSDGPHPMLSDSDWLASFSAGAVVWTRRVSTGPVQQIALRFDCECPYAELTTNSFGPDYDMAANETYYYMPAGDGTHRQTVFSTDHSQILTCTSSGAFDQAGTTVFELIPWSVVAGVGAAMDAYANALMPLPAIGVPTSLTFTRIEQ